jgi:hypothetical protein
MSDFNPYAAPVTDLSTPRSPDEVGVWRDGDLLIMSKDGELPDRCLKCNAPAEGWRLRRNLSWHPQGYYLIILFNLIIYVIVALIVRKTAKVQVPLCPEHRRRRRRFIALAWLGCLLGPAVIVVGAIAGDSLRGSVSSDVADSVTVGVILAGLGLFIAGLVLAVIVSNTVSIAKIDKRYVWMKKVSPALLAGLPDWRS